MASRQIERARKMEAEAKAIRRREKAFWDEVEARLDEIQERFFVQKIAVGQDKKNSASSAPPFEVVDDDLETEERAIARMLDLELEDDFF